MSSDYVDVVLVKRRNITPEQRALFRAPAWTRLESGDVVVVDDKYYLDETEEMVVIASHTFAKDSEALRLLLLAMDCDRLEPIKAKATYTTLKYTDDEGVKEE